MTAEIAAAMTFVGEQTNAKIKQFLSRSPAAFRDAVDEVVARLEERQTE